MYNLAKDRNSKMSSCSEQLVFKNCHTEEHSYYVDPYFGCEFNCCYCNSSIFSQTKWPKEILRHHNLIDQLKQNLELFKPQYIYLGYHSDPYQACEAKLLQTRKILELFNKKDIFVGITTKSELILRDLDLLKEMKNVSVSISVAFHKEEDRRIFEGNTLNLQQRINIIETLKSNNINTKGLIFPLIPYITNHIILTGELLRVTKTILVNGPNYAGTFHKYNYNLRKILSTDYKKIEDSIYDVLAEKNHIYWLKVKEDMKVLQRVLDLYISINL